MTAKEYLKRAEDIQNKIEARIVMINGRYSASEYKGINYDAVGSHGSGGNGTENAYIAALDFDEKTMEEIKQLYEELNKIKTVIKAVDNGMQERVLTLVFIKGMDFDEVGEIVNYSRTQVIRFYNAGLTKVSKILKDGTKWY